jgi:tetratricopeptide (TPR) repeat protein
MHIMESHAITVNRVLSCNILPIFVDKREMNLRIPLSILLLASLVGCTSTSAPQSSTKFTAQTYYAAGQFAESQRNYSQATAEYRLAAQANGPHAPSFYRIAIIYTQLKDYPHAIEAWNQYVDATSGAALAYGDLAYAYELARNIPEATQAYQAALKKEPANPTCRFNYGRLLAREGNISAAEDQLHGILSDGQMHYQIGLICEAQHNSAEAHTQFAQAIAVDPQLLDAKAHLIDLESVSSAK